MTIADRDAFLALLARDIGEDERIILCGFPGNPDDVGPSAWRPRPWTPGRDIALGPRDNAYATVSAFRRAGDGSFRRRGETFAAGLALMVDDVGTKVPVGKVSVLQPTARIETSEGNEQWWYFLAEPERDAERFDATIRAFISSRLLGADPGMSGVTRVGRLPGHVNGKPARNGWMCKLHELHPDRLYTIEDLLHAFELQLHGRRVKRTPLPSEDALRRNEAFGNVYQWLRDRRLLKRGGPDLSGWTEMHCPWLGEHTGGADTGAAIREPAAENDWYGAFRCHHGHCADRGWAELTDFIAEASAEELEHAKP